jgi:hypothetical protein
VQDSISKQHTMNTPAQFQDSYLFLWSPLFVSRFLLSCTAAVAMHTAINSSVNSNEGYAGNEEVEANQGSSKTTV